MSKADELEGKWDEGLKNDNLDPGGVFSDLLDYTRTLEAAIELLKLKQVK